MLWRRVANRISLAASGALMAGAIAAELERLIPRSPQLERLIPRSPQPVTPLYVAPAAEALDVAVWPAAAAIFVGEKAQFYAAVLSSDGTVDCDASHIVPDMGVRFSEFGAAGCDSAIARLDFSLLQDTIPRFARFRWPRQSAGVRAAYDSIRVNLVVSSGVATVLDTLFPAAADTFFVWRAGTEGQTYSVRARAIGYKEDLTSEGDFAAPRTFGYPAPLILVPLDPVPVSVDTLRG